MPIDYSKWDNINTDSESESEEEFQRIRDSREEPKRVLSADTTSGHVCAFCLKKNIETFQCCSCKLTYYCSEDCFLKHALIHSAFCKETAPLDEWQGSQCLQHFRPNLYQPEHYFTRVLIRLREIIYDDFNPEKDFTCDMDVGDIGYQLHVRGCGQMTKNEADTLINRFWAIPGMADFMLLTNLSVPEDMEVECGMEHWYRSATVEIGYFIIGQLIISACYDHCPRRMMASSTWDGGSSLREDHIGIAARERLIELFASGDVLENTSFGGCANFVRNVLDRHPERWEEFLSRGVIDEFLHEIEIDNGLTCVPVVKRLTKEFPQTLDSLSLLSLLCRAYHAYNPDSYTAEDFPEPSNALLEFLQSVKKANVKAMFQYIIRDELLHDGLPKGVRLDTIIFWMSYADSDMQFEDSRGAHDFFSMNAFLKDDSKNLMHRKYMLDILSLRKSETMMKESIRYRNRSASRCWNNETMEFDDVENPEYLKLSIFDRKFKKICMNCEKTENDFDQDIRFMRCGRCRKVLYCGKECQKKDLKEHNWECCVNEQFLETSV